MTRFTRLGNTLALHWTCLCVASLFCADLSQATPTLREIPWLETCDGSTIEAVTENGRTVGVTALATGFAKTRQWSVHYLDGQPVTAEFREYARGRIQTGDKAGEPSGVDPLERLETFRFQEGRFAIPDKALHDQLADILARAATP